MSKWPFTAKGTGVIKIIILRGRDYPGSSKWALHVIRIRVRGHKKFHSLRRQCEKKKKRQCDHWNLKLQKEPALLTLWSWTSIIQNWENKLLLCRPFRKIGIVHICYSHIGFWNTRILGSLEALSANPVSWSWATAAALKGRTWVCQAAWLAHPPRVSHETHCEKWPSWAL